MCPWAAFAIDYIIYNSAFSIFHYQFFPYLLARVRESGLVRNINKSTKVRERRKRWERLRLYKGMSMGGIPAFFPFLSPKQIHIYSLP